MSDTTTMASRVAKRFLAGSDSVELKVPDQAVKMVGLIHDERSGRWTYWVQGASGMKSSYPHKDRFTSKAKMREVMRNQMNVRDTDKYLDQLDKKHDAGHRAPSKRDQKRGLEVEAFTALKKAGIDVGPDTMFMGPVLNVFVPASDSRKAKSVLKRLGWKDLRILDAADGGFEDAHYTEVIIADPEDLWII